MRRGSNPRYPMEAKGVGVIQHQSKKTYMFLVLWSDRNNILIYRTFEEFKRFHASLKKKFPIEAGQMKRSERSIPKFKDAPVLTVRRETRRFLVRLKLLESYVQELLRMDAKISQGDDVTAFFTPHTRDLDPAFHENSIVIMPSEAGDGRRDVSKQQASDAVIQPIRAEQYCCVATYETTDTKNRPFKVRRGEFMDVLLKDTTGWWLVENEEKHLAWFPAPYLSKPSTSREASSRRPSPDTGELYFSVKCYEAKDSDELSMNIGVVVKVLEKSDNGWWLVWYNEAVGYVPSMFLRPYRNPHQKFQAITKNGLYASTPNIQESASPTQPRRVSLEEVPSQSSGFDDGTDGTRKPLQRRQSRSLSSLPTTASKKIRPPLTLELGVLPEQAVSGMKPTPSPRNIILAPENTEPLYVNSSTMEGDGQWICKPKPRGHLRKDDGLGESFSTSGSDESLSSSSSDSRFKVPKVPQKPGLHEILERCTTVTKEALQRAAPNPNSVTIPVTPKSGSTNSF